MYLNLRSRLLIIFSVAALASCANAQVIRFDPASLPGGSKSITSWTESGFYFFARNPINNAITNILGHTDSKSAAGYPDNGSAYLHASGKLAIYNANARPFSLLAVDLAEYSLLFAEPMEVTFTGFRFDGTTVTQSFTVDGIMDGIGPATDFQTFYFDSSFTNLAWAEGSTGAWHVDNLAVAVQSCAPPPSGLVSWWRAENNAADNWNSNDASTGTKFAAGKVGLAFSNPNISAPDSPSLRFTNAITIETWVNPSTSSGTARTIVSKFDYTSTTVVRNSTNSSFFLGTMNNGRSFFVVSPKGSPVTNTTIIAAQPLPTNQWSFVVATYDGAALRLYVNGDLAAQTNYNGGIFAGTSALGIGALLDGRRYVLPFSGLIDEVSLYNRALTDGEIQAIFNADVVGKCLVAPSIVTQPQDQVIPLGEDVKFTVAVTGTKPLKYQWFFRQAPLAGATNSSLVLEKVKANQAGSYQVRVTNTVGLAWSTGPRLTLLPAPTCTDTPAGLISWWPGDGNLADAMGTNNITIFSPTLYVTGKVDRSFSLSSVSAVRRIEVNSSTSLNFGSNADFSIEMWIKTGASNTVIPNVPLFEKRDGGTSWIGYSLSLNQGRLAFVMGSSPLSATNVSSFVSPGPDLRDAMFHHVAVSVNRTSTSGGNLYVDGQLVLNFDPTPRKGSLITGTPLYMGFPTSTTSNWYFFGLIDEPAIYNRALSAAEILAIRHAGAAGKCKVKPSILVQPVSQKVAVGSNVTFSVVATGTPRLHYQWLFSSGQNIFGATNSSYSFNVKSGGTYSVRVTNVFGSITSSNAVLTANFVPTAMSRSITILEDNQAVISLLGQDANGDRLTFAILTPPSNGSLTLGTSDYVIYRPSPNYNGPDSFTFKVNDGLADSAPATVSITVLPVNDAPVAQSQSVSLNEDSAAAINLVAFDADGDSLTFSVGVPAHGTLTGAAPNITYRPNINYFGPDSFTFKVNDGLADSAPATVSITVLRVNDSPVAVARPFPLVTLSPDDTNGFVISLNNINATVYFDGSQSSDVENDSLQFFWFEEGAASPFATGVVATNVLSVGAHTILLIVSDGMDTGTNRIVVDVATAGQAVEKLIDLVDGSDLLHKDTHPLVVILNAASESFDRGNPTPGINQLEAFQNKVRAQISPDDSALTDLFIQAAQKIIYAFGSSNNQPRIMRLDSKSRGNFYIQIAGHQGRVYLLQASTNLVDWETVGVAHDTGNGAYGFEDAEASRFAIRFYRVVSP